MSLAPNVDLKRVAGEVAFLKGALTLSRADRRKYGIREPRWKLEGELEMREKMLEFAEEAAKRVVVAA